MSNELKPGDRVRLTGWVTKERERFFENDHVIDFPIISEVIRSADKSRTTQVVINGYTWWLDHFTYEKITP